jgi:putative peptidoglycan lipid II flippase
LTPSHRIEACLLKCLPLKMRRRLQQASSEDRAIVQGMLWVMVFLLLAKAIAAGKEVVVAYRYGTSAVVDGYLFVFNLAQWPASVFSSVTAIILIPYLVKLQKEQPVQARQLQAGLLPLAFLLGIAASVLYGVLMWWVVGRTEVGLTAQSQSAALTALPWVAPGIAFAFMGAVLSNWLMSQRRHTNTLLEATPAAVIAICLLVWPVAGGQAWDVWPLAVGTLLGLFLQNVLLSRSSQQRLDFAHLGIIVQHWPALRRAFGIMLLAQVVMTSASTLDQFFAVRMGEGVLAGYSYAERIMALVLALTSVVIGRAMLPVFSSVSDTRTSFVMAARWAWRFAGLGVLGALVVFLIAEWAVMLLFQRGAFTANDTREVAKILRILALQLPFYLFAIVLVQWLGAAGKAAWLLLGAVAGVSAKSSGVLLWYDHGALALAASTALMYGASALTIYGTARIVLKLEITDGDGINR